VSGYSNDVEAIAWFHAYVVDGCDTEPVPTNWQDYLHSAKAFYAIAHGADAEHVQMGEIDVDHTSHHDPHPAGTYVPVAEVERLREAHQEILDMGCPFGREGDWLAKAQRISSEALSGRYPNPDRQRS
jgi:hypothetical protein